MARAVILLFDNDEDAQEFLDADKAYDRLEPAARAEVIAVYAVPTKFCECTEFDPETAKGIYPRGARLGWHVHRKCGKPAKNSWQMPKNLLTPGQLAKFTNFYFHFLTDAGEHGIRRNSNV